MASTEDAIPPTPVDGKAAEGIQPPEAPGAAEAAENGAPKMSKNAMKKAAKGALNPKVKDPNRWVKKEESKNDKAKKDKEKDKKEEVKATYTGPADGAKKDTANEMPAAYQPVYVEAAWQDWWEKSGYYGCEAKSAADVPPDKKFVLVIPPPNVTGSLHLGHALTGAIQDTLTRWHRMRGDATLYVPGIDHAGIATQSVVEKKLKREENVTRHDLGREDFVKRVWEWKEEYGGRITKQIRHLASSVDWTREAFTMDPKLSRAVTEAFARFHEAGLIYRATRLVNWSCALKSAISDIEVDFLDLDGRTMLSCPGHTKQAKYEFGTLTHFAYKLDGDDSQELVVATTRLETMLGDTAVAIHPEDARYKHLHGKFLVHPFNDRKIPVVLDPVLVDMSFGTGAVKVTPAHDPNDYECGKRNDLPMITILNEDGTINAQGAPFEGLMRYDARIAVEKALEERGLLRGKEPNKMRLGLCSRSGDIIEPLLTPQWYVSCGGMAERAVEAVRGGELKILPAFHEKTWYQWLDNCRDWCVSRQLWWGHRIPAYFATKAGEELDRNDPVNNDRWVVARSQEDALKQAADKLGVPQDQVSLVQDEDVLDTWFSSGLFPFSVFGWPDNTPDLQAFYPTTLLETGMDILFFWVARMVMMGLQLTDQLPFKTIYLHAMVRDKYGRKMSKSLGNVIDPLEVIYGCSLDTLHEKLEQGNLPAKEIQKAKAAQTADFPEGIPECGADALRFGLLAYTVQGRDVNLDISRVVGYRNFCNKLWNATRFALQYVTDLEPSLDMLSRLAQAPNKAPRDRWILSRLTATISECSKCLQEYQFGALTTALYSFWLYDLCDYYLELIKPVVNDMSEGNAEARRVAQGCLYASLEIGLRLMHPVMPFVTEELWQRLPGRGSLGPQEPASIMVAPYPEPEPSLADPAAEADMDVVKSAIHAARSLRADYNLKPQLKAEFYARSATPEKHAVLSRQADDVATLAKAQSVTPLLMEEPPAGSAVHIVDDQLQVYVQLRGLVDFEGEIQKLEKQMATKLQPLIDALVKKTDMPDYEQKVPEKVREANSKKMEEYQAQKDSIDKAIDQFRKMM